MEGVQVLSGVQSALQDIARAELQGTVLFVDRPAADVLHCSLGSGALVDQFKVRRIVALDDQDELEHAWRGAGVVRKAAVLLGEFYFVCGSLTPIAGGLLGEYGPHLEAILKCAPVEECLVLVGLPEQAHREHITSSPSQQSDTPFQLWTKKLTAALRASPARPTKAAPPLVAIVHLPALCCR